MNLIFIRHGETNGNIQKRYIGKTDEPLCRKGKENLKSRTYPECDIVVSSPMKRCIETADIIYPTKNKIVCEDLRECDFGNFEGKNYIELSNDKEYQSWIDSGGKISFPNGESIEEFCDRCICAFIDTISGLNKNETVAFVVHGGTIMALMEKYAVPHKDYYDYMIGNGEYYTAVYDEKNIITRIRKI